jgi:carboxylesterase
VTATSPLLPGAEPWSCEGRDDRADVGVIITHGFTSNPNATSPLGRRLQDEGFAVEVLLLPGHGTTHKHMGRTRYRDWRAHVEQAVDRMTARCSKVVLVGHSLGGTISLDIASRRPDDVAGVVVINSPILDRKGLIPKLAPYLQHVLPALPRDLAGLPTDDIKRHGASERAYAMVPAKAAQSVQNEMARIRAQLGDLDQALLVIYSPEDHTVDPADSKALRGLVASDDVSEVVCENSYHVPLIDHDQQLVEDQITAFVTRISAA